jgi:hypothetical protein
MKTVSRHNFRQSLICAICLLAFNINTGVKASPPTDDDPAPELSDSRGVQGKQTLIPVDQGDRTLTPENQGKQTLTPVDRGVETLTPEDEAKIQKIPWDPEPKPCNPPAGSPSGRKVWINIFTTAIGRSGTDESCPPVGKSYTRTNPQYVYCRQKGGVVSDKNHNTNYWWLWTDLDTGHSGWISAYYIKGQGNNQAKGIPDCPR